MAFTLRMTILAGGIALALPAALAAQAMAPAAVPVTNAATTLDAALVPLNSTTPVIQPLPGLAGAGGEVLGDVQPWSEIDARALYILLAGIGSEGLDPADYDLPGLQAAIDAGPGPELDAKASQAFRWLVEDLRDGRTPMEARKQWFVADPDRDRFPTAGLMAEALASHDVAGVIEKLTPHHPDYLALREELAVTPAEDKARIALIRANMDRWRWLARDLGQQYLITNVPEYQLRLTVKDQIIRTYRTIVGKPGRNATPQLAEIVEGVIFNPTWTVPQSIVKGEGLGAKVLSNPAWARSAGYAATKGANGFVSVVQQPGPTNSLGLMKLDMPNPHAIFLHDTPSRNLFKQDSRALSHGCIRTERALELALTMAILGGTDKDEAVAISASGEYTRVPLQKTFPVYITYFTMGRDIDGELRTFEDIYDRDAPVLASFSAPRVANRARVTSEEAVEIVDDLQDS
jgi:murein L,D-transpeptidase YcbB/YkuD